MPPRSAERRRRQQPRQRDQCPGDRGHHERRPGDLAADQRRRADRPRLEQLQVLQILAKIDAQNLRRQQRAIRGAAGGEHANQGGKAASSTDGDDQDDQRRDDRRKAQDNPSVDNAKHLRHALPDERHFKTTRRRQAPFGFAAPVSCGRCCERMSRRSRMSPLAAWKIPSVTINQTSITPRTAAPCQCRCIRRPIAREPGPGQRLERLEQQARQPGRRHGCDTRQRILDRDNRLRSKDTPEAQADEGGRAEHGNQRQTRQTADARVRRSSRARASVIPEK